jgi:hypothetical protein
MSGKCIRRHWGLFPLPNSRNTRTRAIQHCVGGTKARHLLVRGAWGLLCIYVLGHIAVGYYQGTYTPRSVISLFTSLSAYLSIYTRKKDSVKPAFVQTLSGSPVAHFSGRLQKRFTVTYGRNIATFDKGSPQCKSRAQCCLTRNRLPELFQVDGMDCVSPRHCLRLSFSCAPRVVVESIYSDPCSFQDMIGELVWNSASIDAAIKRHNHTTNSNSKGTSK